MCFCALLLEFSLLGGMVFAQSKVSSLLLGTVFEDLDG